MSKVQRAIFFLLKRGNRLGICYLLLQNILYAVFHTLGYHVFDGIVDCIK